MRYAMQHLPAHAQCHGRLREWPHGWLDILRTLRLAGIGENVLRQTHTTTHVCKSDIEIRTMLQKDYYHLGNAINAETCNGTWREDPPSIRLTVKFNVTRCTFPKTEALSEWRAVRPPRPAARSAPHRHFRAPRRPRTRCTALCAFDATPPSTSCTTLELGDFSQRMGSSNTKLDAPARFLHFRSQQLQSNISKELPLAIARLPDQGDRASCPTGICLPIRFGGAGEHAGRARAKRTRAATGVMSGCTPGPLVLVLRLAVSDLYAGSIMAKWHCRAKPQKKTPDGPRVDAVALSLHAAAERPCMSANTPHASRESSPSQ